MPSDKEVEAEPVEHAVLDTPSTIVVMVLSLLLLLMHTHSTNGC